MEPLPVTSAQVQTETRNDPLLAKVYDFTVNGWPANTDIPLHDYANRQDQLSVCQGCIMWGSRVVVPPRLRSRVLTALHEGHLGVVKMKSLARSYVWWPGLDSQIENLAKSCEGCQQNQRQPQPAPVHTWEWPSTPWQRIHVDYAGPFLDHMFLVVVDAQSKWPEIFPVKTATAAKTVNLLRMLFARTGLPLQLVSDNGSQFMGEEFQQFLKRNGIKHITSAPHHPATNGLAERFVQTFKQSMKASRREDVPLQHKLANFLLAYRNTIHATTGQTPAMLFIGRSLRSHLDLLKPDIRKHVQEKQCSPSQLQRKLRTFDVGQKVLARDYRSTTQKWQAGEILSKTGPLSYTVSVGPTMVWRRHVDQLLDISDGEVITEPKESDALPDSKDIAIAPGYAAGISDTQNTETMDCTSQNVNVSAAPERRYPQRSHRPPERLDL